MKLNDKMRYPYPVLSEYSDDYVSSKFHADFAQCMTKDDYIKIDSNILLDNEDLKSLVFEQKASVGFFLICRRTYFNYLQKASLGKCESYFKKTQFFGEVKIRPLVWTLADIVDFDSELINKEFGGAVTISKGSVIAMGPEFSFSVDQNKYKPFDSIFELSQNESLAEGEFEVDPERERITILATKKTCDSFFKMRNTETGRDLLIGTVYMPVVIEVISRIQLGDDMQNYKWFRVFKGKCDDLGINLFDTSQSCIKIAQKLLKYPFNNVFNAVRKAA